MGADEQIPEMPYELVASWVDEDVREKPGEVAFHYHNVAEWLLVLKGQLTFFSADNKHSFPVGTGQVLYIPQGEIHRVEVGPEGTRYRWGLLVPGMRIDLMGSHAYLNLRKLATGAFGQYTKELHMGL